MRSLSVPSHNFNIFYTCRYRKIYHCRFLPLVPSMAMHVYIESTPKAICLYCSAMVSTTGIRTAQCNGK